jgi:hypothetical protein
MKLTASLALLASLLCSLVTPFARAQTIEKAPPVVIKTVPEAGTKDVAPGVVEIRVTFSKEMKDQAWSFDTLYNREDVQKIFAGANPRYESDRRTFVVKLNLEPNKTYGFWVNSEKLNKFQDPRGIRALPYLLVFKTAAK